MYVVSYISKAQKGMCELLRKAVAEAKEGNTNIKQQVRDIGNKFLNSVEISAQEVVYVVLQLPMRKASRSVIFIKSGGLLKRYVERHECTQNVTLDR